MSTVSPVSHTEVTLSIGLKYLRTDLGMLVVLFTLNIASVTLIGSMQILTDLSGGIKALPLGLK